MNRTKLAFNLIKNRKINELLFRSWLFLAYQHGYIKYWTLGKLSKDKYKIVEINESKMYIYLNDMGISRDLYLYKLREKFATEFFKSFIDENDIILEIGANIGYYALLESKILTNGRIFACEPMSLNRSILEKNIKLNNLTNIQVYPFAIGDLNTELEFFIYDKINLASFNHKKHVKLVKTEMIETVTLDSFVSENLKEINPTVLRMDVEGFEYNVIKGATNIIKNAPNLKIFMEIHPHLLSDDNLNEMLDILKDNNFVIKAIINECYPHYYPYLKSKTLMSMEKVPYGIIGNTYEDLKLFLAERKGTEVFFEKNNQKGIVN